MVDVNESYQRWESRLLENKNLKMAVADKVLEMEIISKFDHIFIDCGSTFTYLSEGIFGDISRYCPLRLYTTNVDILLRYLSCSNRDLIDFRVVGGRFIPEHQSLDGSFFNVPRSDSNFFINTAFIGACPIDSKLNIWGSITDVVKIKQQLIYKSKQIVLLCDESKFQNAKMGSRKVGQLVFNKSEGLFFQIYESDKLVPAKLIIGINQSIANDNLRLMLEAMEQNASARNFIILARAK